MRLIVTLLALIVVACGTDPQSPGQAVADAQPQPTVSVGSKPEQASQAGPQGERGEKGDKGDKGDPGKDGVGVAGADGKDGAAGAVGASGATGASGAAGSAGSNGADALFDVVDGSGTWIGKLAWVDPASSNYYVNRGNMRLQFARDIGRLPNAYMFCTAAGCTGTCRLAITNGVYANVFEVYIDGVQQGAILQATGTRQAAGFAYASRRTGGSCTNTSGSVAGSYAYTEVTPAALGFTYPVSNAEISNTVSSGGAQ